MINLKKEEVEEQLALTGINFTKQDIDLLMEGRNSTLKENIQLDNGVIKDAKIKITIDKENKIKLQYTFKVNEITIPRELGGKTFTDEELEALQKGKAVQSNWEGETIFLQIDKELNAVTVKTQSEINISEVANFEMGGYVFNENEKLKLDSGEKLTGIVMKGKEGFFVASIRVTEDKKGFIYEDYKELTKEQAKELLAAKQQNNILNNIASVGVGENIQQNNVLKNITSVGVNVTNDNKFSEYEEKLYLAIQNNDFEKVLNLSENKPPVSSAFIGKLHSDKNITSDQKIAANTILNISPQKAKQKIIQNVVDSKDASVKVEGKKVKEVDKQINNKKRNAIEKGAKEVFGDM